MAPWTGLPSSPITLPSKAVVWARQIVEKRAAKGIARIGVRSVARMGCNRPPGNGVSNYPEYYRRSKIGKMLPARVLANRDARWYDRPGRNSTIRGAPITLYYSLHSIYRRKKP